jgi:hypothetical protein
MIPRRNAIFLAAALAVVSANLHGDEPKPEDLFRKIFNAIETTMGITINPSKFQVKLLDGKVTVPSIAIKHPVQGTWAVIKNAQFPLGLLFGTVKAADATIRVGRVDVTIDLSKGKFWDQGTSDGRPIPGAPDLVVGKVVFDSANVTVRHGDAPAIVIKNAKASLMKVSIPAEAWSAGNAPGGVWGKLEMKGGTIAQEGLGIEAALEEIGVSFKAGELSLRTLTADVPGRGKIAATGKIDCGGGEPRAYDLTIALDGFKLFPDGAGSASAGTLKMKGKKGAVKLTGSLETGVKKQKKSWKVAGCSSKVKLAIGLVDPAKPKGKAGSITGTLCAGKVTAK